MSDLDFAKPAAGTSGNGYDPFFSGADAEDMGDRKSGFEPIPSGDKTVMKVTQVGVQVGRETGSVTPTLSVEVLEGAAEQTGRKSGMLQLMWLVCKHEDGKGKVLTDGEYAAKRAGFIKDVNRIVHVFGLTGYPSSMLDGDAVERWFAPALGKTFVGDLRIEAGNEQFGPKNKIAVRSLARPEDVVEVKDAKGKVTKKVSAIEEAREAHKKRAERAAKGGGRTAGARKASGPGAF